MTTIIERDLVIESLHAAGLDEENLREDYSGRGMSGRSCFGITHDSLGELLSFFVAMAQENTDEDMDEDIARLASRARQDGMGTSTITYFPGFELDQETS